MFDSHAHYDHKRFDCGRHELLEKMHMEGLDYCVNPAISFESNARMIKELGRYDWIYYTVGIHPCSTYELEADSVFYEEQLKVLTENSKVVAIKTGLDNYRLSYVCIPDDEAQAEEIKQKQRIWFRKLILLGLETKLPFVLHVREANEDAFTILNEFDEKMSGVVHCFGSGSEVADKFIEKGFLLGIGGRITYEEEVGLRECVRKIPLEYILLETDAPFVLPVGVEGKRNTSENLPRIAQVIADIKGVSYADVIRITEENAKKLFGIKSN